ncbi:unnamed protein product [Citrullus colocynthis]|uniref:Uncharacterized protein n=1 Tax=Citrullus colocynthis TaxID=252529 RepID=A0ABP0XZS3_9ROSI
MFGGHHLELFRFGSHNLAPLELVRFGSHHLQHHLWNYDSAATVFNSPSGSTSLDSGSSAKVSILVPLEGFVGWVFF